jgi:hypothetical protein
LSFFVLIEFHGVLRRFMDGFCLNKAGKNCVAILFIRLKMVAIFCQYAKIKVFDYEGFGNVHWRSRQ